MFNNLKAELARCGITQKQISELLGISQNTVTRKFKGLAKWKLDEMQKIADLFPDLAIDYLFKQS